jgi:hypothetical protein
MGKSVMCFFVATVSMFSEFAVANDVPTAKACEDLKASAGVSIIASDYSSSRINLMTPCLFEKNIQLGVTYGLIEYPYVGDSNWEEVLGHELLLSFSIRGDLASNENYTSGIKTDISVGRIRVESEKYKDEDFQESKINSVPEVEIALGFYTTYKSWESNIGLTQRTFETSNVYAVKGEILPRRDLGVRIDFSYLLK